MPPSGRKTKARMRRAPAAETHEGSDAEIPENITTPSRGSRKRVRGADTTTTSATRNTRRKVKDTRALEREDTDNTEQHEQSDNETEPSTPSEQEIIQSLKVAEKHVNATEDLASELLEGQEHVPGYGKIAGRDWVYIIRKVEINIGRPEAHEQRAPGTESNVAEGGLPPTPSASFIIDIDLGPDRQVSRLHAIIHYDGDSREWYIIVNGRNGLRVDNNLLKRGSKAYLRNGSVIEIANTQMAFITTATEQNEGPVWDASILRQAQKSSEDEEEDDPRSNNPRNVPHLAARSQLQDKSIYQADYNGREQTQHQQRTHPHAQQINFPTMPGTPIRGQLSFQRSSPGANYNRGIMMESTEAIDYSAENAKDLKPPHSYAQLIGMAILNAPDGSLTLNNIYKWIMTNFSFYRFHTGGWQNSIRHNLSLNKAFDKKPRGTDEPGKGMKWIIAPAEFDNFVSQGMKGCRRPNPVPGTQSTVASPTSPLAVRVKAHENSTPPLNSFQPTYPLAQEAFTPERGSRRRINEGPESIVGLGIDANGPGEIDFAHRTPRNGYSVANDVAGSPPPLFVTEGDRTGVFDTPFPLRPSQRLAPPSTLRRPSDYITFPSSPAPFWKMSGVNSTPFKPYDLSPLKTPFPYVKRESVNKHEAAKTDKAEEARDEEDEDDSNRHQPDSTSSPLVRSSSSPIQSNASRHLDASPSASRPTTAGAKSLNQSTPTHHDKAASDSATPPLTNGAASAGEEQIPEVASRGSTQEASPVTQIGDPFTSTDNYIASADFSKPSGHVLSKAPDGDAEDDDFDLFRGFESIGNYHARNRSMAQNMSTDPYRRDQYVSR